MAHMLVIDQPCDAEFLTGALLERAGMDVGYSAIGDTTVLNVRVIDGNLMVIELMAPKPRGFEVIRAARRLTPGAPVAVVSAGNLVPGPDAALRLGGEPGNPGELEEQVVWREFMDIVDARPAAMPQASATPNIDAQSIAALMVGAPTAH